MLVCIWNIRLVRCPDFIIRDDKKLQTYKTTISDFEKKAMRSSRNLFPEVRHTILSFQPINGPIMTTEWKASDIFGAVDHRGSVASGLVIGRVNNCTNIETF